MAGFIKSIPNFYLNGYMITSQQISPETAKWLMLLTLPGVVFTVMRRMSNAERGFWVVLLGTTILAAGVVLSDDGMRVLLVTNVIIAYLLALGFASPAALRTGPYVTRPVPSWRNGAILLIVLFVGLLIVPAVSRTVLASDLRTLPKMLPSAANQTAVLGGQFLMGFIVVADNDNHRYSAPTVRLSEFDKLFTQVELFDHPAPLLALARARVPFAFVCDPAGVLVGSPIYNYYIAPAEILQHPNVKMWRLTFDTSAIPPTSDAPIFDAVEAQAVPLKIRPPKQRVPEGLETKPPFSRFSPPNR